VLELFATDGAGPDEAVRAGLERRLGPWGITITTAPEQDHTPPLIERST